ncbi:hypothetical protein BN59_02740 [Legionella massiliensis]|uniref:Uncharacterized protein n=1 Tax=Legionella massiliensis TaxID=1034943 RepID=A0A078KVJ6_9GAMM|nr:hypothetical protein [Legionella massiliensis]CDZ78430.1 hypothetical protein BN59_02740 [Legionella massiliensis]CEE14168.1 hypothetical protein BN1094_02740 [Legionella massiliensis]
MQKKTDSSIDLQYQNAVHSLVHSFRKNKIANVVSSAGNFELVNRTTLEWHKNAVYKLRCELGELADLMDSTNEDSNDYKELLKRKTALRAEIQALKPQDRSTPGFVFASGGCKRIYSTTAGDVIALPNLDNFIDAYSARTNFNFVYDNWQRVVADEMQMTTALAGLGLETQTLREVTLSHEGHQLSALVMPSFQKLAIEGIQARDKKNEDCFGSSMLFARLDNVTDEKHLKGLIKKPCDDIIQLLTHGIILPSDSFNLVIKDSADTPEHDRAAPQLYSDLNQRVSLFFYDFSDKESSLRPRVEWKFANDSFADETKLRGYANEYLESAIQAIAAALTPVEIDAICKDLGVTPSKLTVDRLIKTQFSPLKEELVEHIVSQTRAQLSSRFAHETIDLEVPVISTEKLARKTETLSKIGLFKEPTLTPISEEKIDSKVDGAKIIVS